LGTNKKPRISSIEATSDSGLKFAPKSKNPIERRNKMLATKYAEYYEIEAQHENEDNVSFRKRVASALREMGHIIEAHEVYTEVAR
jgi:hypothetical protein